MLVNLQLCNYLLLIISEKVLSSHLAVSYNISLYRDTQVAIYRYTQIVYRCISSIYPCYHCQVDVNDVRIFSVRLENHGIMYKRS